MTILDVDIFLTLVQNRNITRTAEQLFLSQSTISHRLAALEKEIGKPLIIRGRGQKNVSLTSWGESFVELAARWRALHEETAQLKLQPDYMELSIGGVHSINNYIMLPFYQEIRSSCSNLNLSLNTHHSWEIYEFVNNQKLDIGFVNNLSYYSGLKTIPIFQEQFCVVRYDPQEVLKSCPVHPNELDPEKEIFHTWSHDYQQWHDYWWPSASHTQISVNEANLLECFFSKPGEWSILPLSVAQSLKQRHPLQISMLMEPPPDRTCYMILSRTPRAKCLPAIPIFQNKLERFLETGTQPPAISFPGD